MLTRVRLISITYILPLLVIFIPQTYGQDSDIGHYKSYFHKNHPIIVENELKKGNLKLQVSVDSHDQVGVVDALMDMGLIHLTRTHDYEQAMDLFIRALTIEDSLGFKDEQVFSYLAMARVFEDVGDHEKSAQLLENALSVVNLLNRTDLKAIVLNELGRMHASLGKSKEALNHYQQVLDLKGQIEPDTEAEAYHNTAHVSLRNRDYQSALQNHKKALAIYRDIQDKDNEALVLNDIGETYILLKNEDKALANHIVSLEIRQSLGDKKGMAESYNNIGIIYYHQKKIDRAMANLELALKAGKESQAQTQTAISNEYLSLCYKLKGDFKKALEFREEQHNIHDFIQNEKIEQRLMARENQYILKKSQSKIDQLETERRQKENELNDQKKSREFLTLLLILVLIIFALIFYLYLLNKRSHKSLLVVHEKINNQNSELLDLNATKDKFFSIIAHDLKGPLNSLTSFSNLLINHFDHLSKEEIQKLARDLDKSLKNLFALLENLLEWARSQTGSIDFNPEPFNLSALLTDNQGLLSPQAQNKKINIENKTKEDLNVHAHRQSVNTVIRNLISNAIKFTPEGGTITLKGERVNGDIRVSITDTGVGITPETIKKLFRIDAKHSTSGTANEKGTGLGLILCKDFIEKNGGRIGVESTVGKGSVFFFTLPAGLNSTNRTI